MAGILVIDTHPGAAEAHAVSKKLVDRLSGSGEACSRISEPCADYRETFETAQADTLVYFPPVDPRQGSLDFSEAEDVFGAASRAGILHVVAISSAEIYGPRPHNIGFLPETRPRTYSGKNAVAGQWIAFEECAERLLDPVRLTLLRPAPMLVPGGDGYFSRLFWGRVAATLPGYDPSLQLLCPEDFVQAICLVVEKRPGGIYNVAPDGVIPLKKALRLARTLRVPVPKGLHAAGREIVQGLDRTGPVDQVDYIRYAWTVSNRKVKQDLGFEPGRSSVEALAAFLAEKPGGPALSADEAAGLTFDDYGMDKSYVAAYGRTLVKFLRHVYWRIEHTGLEHIPRQGRAVLTGVHRGFMPLDAVMTFHLLVAEIGRHPRFLIHPTLIKFPFQFNFMTKLGGMIACQENANYVLGRDELLGIYPEGINGAFIYYRDAYRLGRFGRDEYVKMALRNRAPLVPFVTVGTPEIFPVFGKLNWRWWKRFTLWPCFPIAPPFPLLPVPLPTKWHIQFLPPVHLEEQYPPEAADDPAVVKAISRDVKGRMQAAIDEMLERRKHIFYGSIFEEATA